MQVTLHSTDRVIEIVATDGSVVPARIWEGVTANGIRCYAAITRIAVREDVDLREFERELMEMPHRRPSTESAVAIPARLVL
jgi:hypothetical protein